MGLLKEFTVNIDSATLDNVSEQSKTRLVLAPSTEKALGELQKNIRGELEIGQIVEIAIELLLKAQNKEIRVVDKETSKTIEAYFLWK